MNFNFNNDRPIYIQLTEELELGIITGVFKSGEKLPSVRDLALKIKANPNTIQKALTILEDKKLIYTERTNGKYVTTNTKLIEKLKQDLAKEKVQTFLLEMENLGFTKEETYLYLQEQGGEK